MIIALVVLLALLRPPRRKNRALAACLIVAVVASGCVGPGTTREGPSLTLKVSNEASEPAQVTVTIYKEGGDSPLFDEVYALEAGGEREVRTNLSAGRYSVDARTASGAQGEYVFVLRSEDEATLRVIHDAEGIRIGIIDRD